MIMPSDSNAIQKVLIVDNNIHETDMLNEWFRRNGFQVEVVTDSLQAISRVRITDYSLVLIDMDLSGDLGGFETIWMMKTIVSGSKISLLSDRLTPELERKAASFGVHHWIRKPLNRQTTPAEIKQVLLDGGEKHTGHSWQLIKEFIQHIAG